MAKPELRDHRKFLKLRRLLGEPTPHVLGYLDCLWHRGYQTGDPAVGDAMDVEAAAEYPGEPGRFAEAAHQAGFIDRAEDGTFLIHDLYEHAPRYVRLRMARKGKVPTAHNGAHSVRDLEPEGAQTASPPKAQTQTKNQEPEEDTKDREPPPPDPPKRFVPPTTAEVADYCRERGNGIDPEQFVDFYASKGWKVGAEAMKDWRACVRTWEKRKRDGPGRTRSRDRGAEYLRMGADAGASDAE